MAYLTGPIKFIGRLGGVVATQTPHGISVIEIGGVTRSRLLNDFEFERSRETSAEFGGASVLAKMVYDPLKKYSDVFKLRMWNYLLEETSRVVQDSVVMGRGKRPA